MRALITGCSTGFGRATAIELHKRGFEVIATARRPQALEDLDVAAKLPCDVDDDASVAALRDAAGEVDVLVNNAGFGVIGPVERVPLADVKRIFETNVFGAVRMMQAFVPQMRERGSGTVVNVSSVAGRISYPLSGFYAASKFALEAISEALHYEMGHFGIRVAIIEPGRIQTEFRSNADFRGVDSPPYDELHELWEAAMAKLGEGTEAPGSEAVAHAIAEAIETDEPKLRWPVGADAELAIPSRRAMDDAEFEAAMRARLGFDW